MLLGYLRPTAKRDSPLIRFAIVDVLTGRVRYVGGSISAAATAFDPGTVHGRGTTDQAAVENALMNRNEIRKLQAAVNNGKEQ